MDKVHVNPKGRIYLTGLDQEELTSDLTRFLTERRQKPYRVKQIIGWLYHHARTDFDDMINLPDKLRTELRNNFSILSLELGQHLCAKDRTEKFLWTTSDGQTIESVYMPAVKKATLCLSTQIGCSLACSFCTSGTLGFRRNLEAHEIVSQTLAMMAMRSGEAEVSNIVFMGMGEPMLNFDNLAKAICIINDPDLLQIGSRRITVSTAGIPKGIRRLAKEFPQVKLAVSLNAPVDTLRDRLMPINKRYPLKRLMEAVGDFVEITGKRITFEYIIIPGVNDTLSLAYSLKKLIDGIPCKVNLIALNRPGPGGYGAPKAEEIKRFREILMGLLPQSVTLRKSMGGEINAACGQLAGRVFRKGHTRKKVLRS